MFLLSSAGWTYHLPGSRGIDVRLSHFKGYKARYMRAFDYPEALQVPHMLPNPSGLKLFILMFFAQSVPIEQQEITTAILMRINGLAAGLDQMSQRISIEVIQAQAFNVPIARGQRFIILLFAVAPLEMTEELAYNI
ncbi:MAG: hypothetical protein Q9180_002319 [Flavoplaca navasiana]